AGIEIQIDAAQGVDVDLAHIVDLCFPANLEHSLALALHSRTPHQMHHVDLRSAARAMARSAMACARRASAVWSARSASSTSELSAAPWAYCCLVTRTASVAASTCSSDT